MADSGVYGGGPATDTDFICVTSDTIPGRTIDRTIGEVFGLTVRARNVGADIGATLKSLAGGELKGLTKALVASREQAMERMIDQARQRGGNAVVTMRFDVTDARGIGTEVCAYGTAVVVSTS